MDIFHKVMYLLFNTLSRLVIVFLPRSKHLLISWLQPPSAVIMEPQKNQSLSLFPLFPHLYAMKWWASLVVQLVKNLPAMQETPVQFPGQKNPLEEGMATHSSILAWRIPRDRGAWRTTFHGHGVPKESDTTKQLSTVHLRRRKAMDMYHA